MLDELDAALDEANIGRFVDVVKGFLDRSQFIVITHNRKTIAASDTLYGVTMQERGISNIMSVKFAEYDRAGGKLPAPTP
jgi:chromosome segregation protein